MLSWSVIHDEAKTISKSDPFMAHLLQKLILSKSSYSQAMSAVLASHFKGDISENDWYNMIICVFNEVPSRKNKSEINYDCQDEISQLKSLCEIGLYELAVIRDRDPACDNYVNPLIHFKGYKALQAHRVAHRLWQTGRKTTALHIQSLCSDIFTVDIHPAAVIGTGLMIDHGTGIVIGETAVIGTNCSFLHGVTLGSTGKEHGDRHPKLGNSVLIGCNATILGNIRIGNCCKIGSGSIVLKPLPDRVTAVGNPARIIGTVASSTPCTASSMDVALQDVIVPTGETFMETWSVSVDTSTVFDEVDDKRSGQLSALEVAKALTLRFGHHLPQQDVEDAILEIHHGSQDGLVCKDEFEKISARLVEQCNASRSRSGSSLGLSQPMWHI